MNNGYVLTGEQIKKLSSNGISFNVIKKKYGKDRLESISTRNLTEEKKYFIVPDGRIIKINGITFNESNEFILHEVTDISIEENYPF